MGYWSSSFIILACALLGMLIGGAFGLLIFMPGVFYETPDQASMLVVFTFPAGLILGASIGYSIGIKISNKNKTRKN